VGVRVGLLLEKLDRQHRERNNIKHHLDKLFGTMICPEDLYSRHQDNRILSKGLPTENHNNKNNNVVCNNNNSLRMFSITKEDHKLLDQQILLLELGASD